MDHPSWPNRNGEWTIRPHKKGYDMGAIADAIVAYAQPLLEQTDGSIEEMNKAFKIAQICYNLALVPEERREEVISKVQAEASMDDAEFEGFRRSILDPMIRRHEAMFPFLRRGFATGPLQSEPAQVIPKVTPPPEKRTVTDRYAPCPCNSGKKYKFCCGSKRR